MSEQIAQSLELDNNYALLQSIYRGPIHPA